MLQTFLNTDYRRTRKRRIKVEFWHDLVLLIFLFIDWSEFHENAAAPYANKLLTWIFFKTIDHILKDNFVHVESPLFPKYILKKKSIQSKQVIF